MSDTRNRSAATTAPMPAMPRLRRRRPLLRGLLLFVVALLIGAAAVVAAALHWPALARRAVPQLFPAPVVVLPAPRPVQVIAAPVPPTAIPPALLARLDALTTRVVAVEARTRTAMGDADRAEGVLVAFAARRAIDRGEQLGFLEGLLRERFGGTQPAAVATVLTAARQPVTLGQLATELAALRPLLTTRAPGESWWTGVRREFGQLVVLRRSATPSIAIVDRFARAQYNVQAGDVPAALSELARLPGSAGASAWIARATRDAAARRALDAVETAALLTPTAAASPVAPALPASGATIEAAPADATPAT